MQKVVLIGALLMVLIGGAVAQAAPPHRSDFDPRLDVVGVLAPGALGLPGEQITWIITVTNEGTTPGADLLITDTIRSELRLDSAETDHGSFRIENQDVIFTIPVLNPGESAQMRIMTTVLRSPADSPLTNLAQLSAGGGAAPVRAVAELPVPTALPATGYAPTTTLPGENDPSLFEVALLAFAVVAGTAWLVWRRGQYSILN
jgi:uncharacterized repeat protein (TIGR01451 family)